MGSSLRPRLARLSSGPNKQASQPEGVRTLLGVFPTVADASNAVSALIGAGIVPAALEMMDALILQAVNDVTASGALYFSSAANSGNQNDGRSGTWEGDFADGGTVSGAVLLAASRPRR